MFSFFSVIITIQLLLLFLLLVRVCFKHMKAHVIIIFWSKFCHLSVCLFTSWLVTFFYYSVETARSISIMCHMMVIIIIIGWEFRCFQLLTLAPRFLYLGSKWGKCTFSFKETSSSQKIVERMIWYWALLRPQDSSLFYKRNWSANVGAHYGGSKFDRLLEENLLCLKIHNRMTWYFAWKSLTATEIKLLKGHWCVDSRDNKGVDQILTWLSKSCVKVLSRMFRYFEWSFLHVAARNTWSNSRGIIKLVKFEACKVE